MTSIWRRPGALTTAAGFGTVTEQAEQTDHHARWRRPLARALRMAARVLRAAARRLTVGCVRHRPHRAPELEFYAESGAPEGALYVDGRLMGYLEGINRL